MDAPIDDLPTRYRQQVTKYRRQGILIDANLVVLHVVGQVGRAFVTKHKRTKDRGYGEDEYALLQLLLEPFPRRIATPTVLAEVSNLVGQTDARMRYRCLEILAREIEEIEERYDPSRELAGRIDFPELGLADCSILRAAQSGHLVLTDDTGIQVALAAQDRDCRHFTHYRDWLQP